MSTIFTGTVFHALKETLNEIIDDDTDNVESNAVFTKWLDVKTMSDNYEDDMEMGGPGLISEKTEGAEISTGTLREGPITRYIARTFALKLIITEEAMEDVKYDRVLRLARRLKRALWKTADIDATNMLVRATNTAYVGGDGKPLASSSHTLPNGGTYSNVMTTPMSPSRASMIIATSQLKKLPGHDGITEGAKPVAIICPVEQWAIWEGLIGSDKVPESGNNEINVIKGLGLKIIVNPYWSSTTTQWAILTDVDNGLNWRWRRRPRNRSWVDNDNQVMKYSIDARWARGWSDPRGILFVDA